VHLDIKPGNLFVSSVAPPKLQGKGEQGNGEVLERSQNVFKIGDFGLMTMVEDPKVEDGDSRYLPKEILNEDYSHLAKVDIFSLGLSMYELASKTELPKNGDEWHQLRSGTLPPLEHFSEDFNAIIKVGLVLVLVLFLWTTSNPSLFCFFPFSEWSTPTLCSAHLPPTCSWTHWLIITRTSTPSPN